MSRKELSIEERKIIINSHENGISYSEIGKIINRSKSTVQKVINRFKSENLIANKPRTGRPPKLNNREERKIEAIIKKDPFTSAPKIATELKESFGKDVSADTVRRCIKRAGYNARTARKKPHVSEINKEKRMEFATEYKNKTNEFWEKVIFSDESKFNIFGSDGRELVWRKKCEELNPKNTRKTVKHGGGGVMVWGCMSAAGVGNLVFIEETMNKTVYMNILKENLNQSAEKLNIRDEYYFQQDNDPKHTAWDVKMWIIHNTPHILKTPPQSPDLNPIEHLWDHLEKRIRNHTISNKAQLKEIILTEWGQISGDYTKKVVHSMPNRLNEVLRLKGYPTKY